MNRYIFTLLAAFTVIGCFTSACSKIEEPVLEQTQSNRVAIHASISNSVATRLALTDDPDNKIIKAEWKEGDDFIFLVNGKNYTFVYEAESDEFVYDNKNGDFPSKFSSAGSVKASYPATIPADYRTQGGTLADVEELLTLEASIDVTANQPTTDLNLKFNHNSAIIKMTLANEAFKSKSVNIDFYAEDLLPDANIITAKNLAANSDGEVTAYLAVPATGREVQNCAIYATAGESTYKTTLGNNTMTSGRLYNITKRNSNFAEIPLACYLPEGTVFRDAVVAAIGAQESVQIKFIAGSRENLTGAAEIGTGSGAYIKVNGSVIEIHTAAKEFVFNQNCSFMFGSTSTTMESLIPVIAIDFNDCINTSNVTDMSSMFSYSNLVSLDLSNFNTVNVTNMNSMFYCSELKSLDLRNVNTENVTDMGCMFTGCYRLNSLDLSNFNTVNVTNMNAMFDGCDRLNSLDLSNFNTANVTDMSFMFLGCSGLISLDLSNFNTANVTDMNGMFGRCNGLISLDLSNFNTANVTDMRSMFYNCNGLNSLDLSNFNTANVTNMSSMFKSCSSLYFVNLSSFNTEKVKHMGSMFYACWELISLDLMSFDVSNVSVNGFSGMFYSLGSSVDLKPITVKVTKKAYDILITKNTSINENYAIYSYPTE